MVDARRREGGRQLQVVANILMLGFISLGVLILFTIWSIHRAFLDTLGGSLSDLAKHIALLGQGDFRIDITTSFSQESRNMARLNAVIESLFNLRFIRQAKTQDHIAVSTAVLDHATLAALPKSLRDSLQRALIELSPRKLALVLPEIALLNPALAQTITIMADNYQFEELYAALAPVD